MHENYALVIGAVGVAQESHTVCGERFFTLPIEIQRLSGAVDRIQAMVPERLSPQTLSPGTRIMAEGQLRSYRKLEEGHRRLNVFLFVKYLQPIHGDTEDANNVTLQGTLVKTPIYRKTPLGREICDLLLQVPRGFGKSDVIPCIAWGANAARCAMLQEGTTVCVTGRFQSREYQKADASGNIQTRTAYEMSIFDLTLLQP